MKGTLYDSNYIDTLTARNIEYKHSNSQTGFLHTNKHIIDYDNSFAAELCSCFPTAQVCLIDWRDSLITMIVIENVHIVQPLIGP